MSSSQRPVKRRRLKLDLACRPLINDKSPLMSAPAEVRARIFEYLFQGTSLEILHRYRSNGSIAFNLWAPKSTRRRGGILLSCRSLYLEAQPVLARFVRMTLDPAFADDPKFGRFRRDYLPHSRHLRLAYRTELADFHSSMFPSLEQLECPWLIIDDEWGQYDVPSGEEYEEKDLFSLAAHVVDPDADQKLANGWMDAYKSMADRVLAGDEKWAHLSDVFRCLQQLINSKECKFRITTKRDFHLTLVHDMYVGGPRMHLVLKLEIDMATREVLSRHLREIKRDPELYPLYYDNKIMWPIPGLMPDLDINDDPEKYIIQRLSEPDLPNSDDEFPSEDSESEEEEGGGEED